MTKSGHLAWQAGGRPGRHNLEGPEVAEDWVCKKGGKGAPGGRKTLKRGWQFTDLLIINQ